MSATRAAPRLPRRLALAGALLAIALTGTAAAAQPLILKRAAPPAGEATQPEAPAPETSGEEIAPRPLDSQSIVVDSLDAVNAEAVGLIGPDEGGFDTSLWQGTGWSTVAALMPRLPEMSLSPDIRSLSRRLLLSRAVVPDGKPDDASFVQLRVDRLMAIGDVGDALALLATVAEERHDAQFDRTRVDALFFEGRRDDACKKVAGLVDRYQKPYWREAEAFCLALGGDQTRAGLIADLLRERDTDAPPVFFAAIERLSDLETGDVEIDAVPNGLVMSMILAAKIPLPPQVLKNARPAVLRAVALSADADPELRLEAAEKALEFGALSPDEAMKIYRGFPFSDDELENPITTAESAWTPRVRALLLRAAESQPVALGKAEVLRRAWQLGREKGGYGAVVRASLPVLDGIAVDGALATFAGDAARALFAAGRLDRAMAWYGVVAGDSDRAPEMKKAADALWPLAVLAETGDDVAWDPGRLGAWYAALRQSAPEKAMRRALTFFTLLEAMGREVPAKMWRTLLDGPMVSLAPGLNRAWAKTLEDASANRRIGETVLLVATGAAATGDRTFASDAAGYRAIAALRRVGLEADARRLAVETALAAGL